MENSIESPIAASPPPIPVVAQPLTTNVSPASSSLNLFNGNDESDSISSVESFSNNNNNISTEDTTATMEMTLEVAVEPLEKSSDGKDENCKHCQ